MSVLQNYIDTQIANHILHPINDTDAFRCSCGKIIKRPAIKAHFKSAYHLKWQAEEMLLHSEQMRLQCKHTVNPDRKPAHWNKIWEDYEPLDEYQPKVRFG